LDKKIGASRSLSYTAMMFSKLVASKVSEGDSLRPRLVSVEEFVKTFDSLSDTSKFKYLQLFCEGKLKVIQTVKTNH